MKKQTVFNSNWFEETKFNTWLLLSKNEKEARCKLCHKVFDLSDMERQALCCTLSMLIFCFFVCALSFLFSKILKLTCLKVIQCPISYFIWILFWPMLLSCHHWYSTIFFN